MKRASLPRGVTKVSIVQSFRGGSSVEWLAEIYRCERTVIERSIRDVMRRTKKEGRR